MVYRHGVSPLFLCLRALQERPALLTSAGGADAACAAFAELCAERGISAARTPTDTFRRFFASSGAHLSPVCAIMGGACD
jgi:hypothetical protein